MSTRSRLEPKLVTVFREGYSREQFFKDLTAGTVVGIVALPLAIAFAIASGVKPEQGLYTAVVAGFLISALSGSRVQIGGPTGAFIVIVYGVVQQHGYDGLAVATLIAGFLLVLMGLAGMGVVIKYIPYPVTVGFTAGISLIIAAGQIREFAGLAMPEVPGEFVGQVLAYRDAFGTIDATTFMIGVGTVAIIQFWPRITRRIPGSLVAILVTSALVRFADLPVETIATRFGSVPASLPVPRLPSFSWSLATEMFSPAVTIALLAGIESLLSAVVADGMTGRRHRSNMELVGVGIANIASPLFGGIPATGAIARTATNIKNGGRTPVAGMIHAIVLLAIMLFFGQWAALIPMAALAGILLVVAYNMSEWRLFIKLFRGPKSDVMVLLTTFLLTILIDLTVAIQVGVVLAALLFMKRMADVTQAGYITRMIRDQEEEDDPGSIRRFDVPDGVEVFEVDGPFFFGAADKFKEAIHLIEEKPRVLILRLRKVPAIDATGLTALEQVLDQTQRDGTRLLLSGVHSQPMTTMRRSGLLDRIGEENTFDTIESALMSARRLVEA